MKKIIIIVIFLSIYFLSFSQTDKSKLFGNWLKIKTETLDGKITTGKFGASNIYLRVSIAKNKISFGFTPYDKGEEFDYNIDHDTIEIEFHDLYYDNQKYPESNYFIEKLDDNNLILKTIFENKEIKYFFTNQKAFQPALIDSAYQFDNDTILLFKVATPGSYYKAYYSDALVSERFFPLRPYYNKNGGFGNYINQHFKFKGDSKKNEFSKPIKVSFYIDSKGNISNIILLEGFQEYYDAQIIKLITKSNKDWVPNIIVKPHCYASMIFTFIIFDKHK